jgi:hypothetical protein
MAFGLEGSTMTEQSRLTRAEKSFLRSFVEDAWNAELDEALTALYEDFLKWADHGMSAVDLAAKIHEFHDGVARETYNRYMTLDPAITISRAIALGLVEEESVGEQLVQKLASNIESFRKLNDDGDAEQAS